MNRAMIRDMLAAMATRQFAIIIAIGWGMLAMALAADVVTGLGGGNWIIWHRLFYGMSFLVVLLGSAMLAHAMAQCTKVEAEVEFESRFREILEDIDLMAACLDSHGIALFCNDALLRITGWQRRDVLGKDWNDIFLAKSDHDAFRRFISQIAGDHSGQIRRDWEILTRTDDRRLISWNACPTRDSLGRILGVALIGTDVTDSRASQEQIRKLSYAVEQSPSVIMLVDTEGRIEYVNPKFTELTGYTMEEMRGKNPRILKSGETSSTEYTSLWRTISQGGEWRGLFHNRKKNGDLYWEAASISALRDGNGNITHYLAVKEDVTERLRLEEEVAQNNAVIAKNEALAVTGKMANMIAHDLRNPLSAVKMGLQILGREASRDWRDEEREMRQIALEQVQYMEEILADLLTYSRPDALTLEWLNIDTLLDTTINTVQKHVHDHRVRVNCDYQAGLPTIHADARKLRQTFSNIIVNAIQASDDQPANRRVVEIATALDIEAGGPRVRVDIRDRGRGVGGDLGDQIFEPFFTTRSKGTGLGLAIVKRIVEQHHGSVELTARSRGGVQVTVRLPIGPIEQAVGPEKPPLGEAVRETAVDERTRQPTGAP